jgi:hypothetical protein
MKRAVPKNTAHSSLTAPIATRCDGDLTCDIVLVVVDVEAKRPADEVLYELTEGSFAVERALWASEDVVAVWEERGGVGRGVCGDVEDVPDVGGEGDGRVLE